MKVCKLASGTASAGILHLKKGGQRVPTWTAHAGLQQPAGREAGVTRGCLPAVLGGAQQCSMPAPQMRAPLPRSVR